MRENKRRILFKRADSKFSELDQYIDKRDEKGLYGLILKKDIPDNVKELAAYHLVLIYRDRNDRIKLRALLKNPNPKIVECAGLALTAVLLKLKDVQGLKALMNIPSDKLHKSVERALGMLKLWEQRDILKTDKIKK